MKFYKVWTVYEEHDTESDEIVQLDSDELMSRGVDPVAAAVCIGQAMTLDVAVEMANDLTWSFGFERVDFESEGN